MAKYIDAEKLKKIVEQAKQRALKGIEVDEDMYCDGRADAFEEVLLEITSLQQEQPEVDLEKEIELYFDGWTNSPDYFQALNAEGECVFTDEIIEIARHFYELGLNARKKEQL